MGREVMIMENGWLHCQEMRQNQEMTLRNETSEKEEQVNVAFQMLSKKGTAN